MSTTTNIVVAVIALLLGGFLNFYGNKPWILYLPLAGVLLAVGYCGHLYISSLRQHGSSQQQTGPTDEPETIPATAPTPMSKSIQGNTISSNNQVAGFTGINTGTVNLGRENRIITPQQREVFLRLNKPYPRGLVGITLGSNDPESASFATQLKSLLVEAGYDANHSFGSIMTFGGSAPPSGVAVGVASETDVPDHARPLVGTLRESGIPADFVLDHRTARTSVNITITLPFEE